MTPLPKAPWVELGVDFTGPFPSGEYLLVVIDLYSRYVEVDCLKSTSARTVIPVLDAIFPRHGIPDIVRSDNGPPFNSCDFALFSEYLGFRHQRITPFWSQANATAECTMASLKKIMQTAHIEGKPWQQELNKFLRNYRATPHCTTGVSPAEALFNRK